MIIAEISVIPIGEGTSVSRFVRIAVNELKKTKLKMCLGAMSTSIEAESLEEVLDAVKTAHKAVVKAGAKRVVTTVKIDDRRDKQATMETKMRAVK